jgi:hypothetical protein
MGRPQDVIPPKTGVHSEVRERAEWTPFPSAVVPPAAVVWHIGTRRPRTLVPSATPERPNSLGRASPGLLDLLTLLFEARR